MEKNSGSRIVIDTISRKVARAITLFVEVFGFELVRVKRSGRKKSSIRLIRPVLGGEKLKPALHMNGSGETNGYFTVNVGCDAGIKHMKSALALMVKESLSLKRTPVVFAPRLEPSHNFGRPVDASWDKYVDLDRIAITNNGSTCQIRALQQGALADMDDLAVLEVKAKHLITATENAAYQLIVKNNPSGLGLDGFYSHDDFDFDVELCPSRLVLDHADRVSRLLGEYHSMHVRRGDKLTDKKGCPNLEQDTRPERIYETISRVLQKGSRVYILTDEKAPNYFDLLKKDYQVVQYFDFPELKALVEGDYADNFLLYEVEQLIFARAKTRIHTFAHPKGKSRISLTSDIGWT
jgi:hypothetical protein